MLNHILNDYISEQEAIETLTTLTKIKITISDIKKCADKGVVPAYMQFMPRDTSLYTGASFHAAYEVALKNANLEEITTLDPSYGYGYEDDFWKILPYPLPNDNIITATDGVSYRILVSRTDGKLESITNEHYVRVYTDDEVRKCAKNIKTYLSKGEIQQTSHAHQQRWLAQRQSDDDITVWVPSPFTNNENSQNSKLKDNRERTSLHLIIAALASQAGYSLDKPKEAEARLIKDLALMGICDDMGGKGTAEKHFEAAELTARDAKKKSNIRLSEK